MKRYAPACLVAFLFQGGIASAELCRVGSQVTLSKELDTGLQEKDGHWFDIGMDAKPCTVAVIRGKGKIPAQCKNADKMTATGVVRKLNLLVLEVTSVKCE
jgi:hypothetical protein